MHSEKNTEKKFENHKEKSLTSLQKEAASQQGTICGMPKRLFVVILSCLGMAVSYADRMNLSIAIIPMSEEFGWSPEVKGRIFSMFYLGYMATQILGGWVADRWGAKWVFAAGAFGWSIFTLLSPAGARLNIATFVLMRVFLGASEGVSFPAVNSLLAKWLPKSERSRATGAINSFTYAGAIIALLLSPISIKLYEWPSVFYLFGGIGLVWLVPWILFVDSNPKVSLPDDTQTATGAISKTTLMKKGDDISIPVSSSSTTRDAPSSVPFAKILKHKYTWAIITNQYCNCWGYFILLQWIPLYYKESFGVQMKDLGIYSIIPYCAQFLGGFVVGFVADFLVSRNIVSLVWVRKGSQVIALLGAAFFVCMAGWVASDINQGVIFITCALAVNSLTNAGSFVGHFDINQEYAGVIYGLGNTASTIAGALGQWVTGMILDYTGSWSIVFAVTAVHYIVGAVFWLALAHPDNKLVI